jgi:hypothetical protein
VLVVLAINSVSCPSLPEPPSSLVKYKIDDLLQQIPSDLGTLATALVDVVKAYQSRFGFGEADIYVRTFAPLPAADVTSQTVPFTPLATLPRSSVNVDNAQPFPVVGWLKLRWVHTLDASTGNAGGTAVFIGADPPHLPHLHAHIAGQALHATFVAGTEPTNPS